MGFFFNTAGSLTLTLFIGLLAGVQMNTTMAESTGSADENCRNLATAVDGENGRNLAAAVEPFLEKDGLLVMEAESVTRVNPWKKESNIKGFTGKGFLRMDGNTLGGKGGPNGRLSYTFKISNAGEYRMAIHSYKNSHEREDWSNDCYTKLVGHSGYQGEDTKMYLGGKTFKWDWATKHEPGHNKKIAKYTFDKPGIYELQISGRSKNYRINRIVLFGIGKVSEEKALALARPESLRKGGVNPPPTDAPQDAPTESPEDSDPLTDNPENSSPIGDADLPFLEQKGLVVMEAESVARRNPWKLEKMIEGFTGNGYFRMNGNELKGGEAKGRLSYFFQISKAGQYRMAIHSYKNSDKRDDWSDDCFTKLVGHSGYQGEDTKMYLGGQAFKWNWAVKHDIKRALKTAKYTFEEPGTYELQVSGRSKNFIIDRIVLFRIGQVSEEKALALKRPESPTVVGAVKIDLVLVNADGSSPVDLLALTEGTTVDLAALPTTRLTIRAYMNVAPVDRVRFWFNGRSRTQLDAPYALRGGIEEGDDILFKPVDNLANAGSKTITVEALRENGKIIAQQTINFSMRNSANSGRRTSDYDGITGFILFNTDSGNMIGPLEDGDVVTLADTGTSLTLVANTVQMQGVVIVFHFDRKHQCEEGLAPFALGGDSMGEFFEFKPLATLGRHTVTASEYRVAMDGSQEITGSRSISFTVEE